VYPLRLPVHAAGDDESGSKAFPRMPATEREHDSNVNVNPVYSQPACEARGSVDTPDHEFHQLVGFATSPV
jgi:hypothetical protein